MEPHDLTSLAAAYGDALVGLEKFAILSGVSPSGLRSRSTRDDASFPTPLSSPSGGPHYRFADLVTWLGPTAPEGAPPDPTDPAATTRAERVAEWALDEALARVAAELGSDVALRIMGATALAVTAGWEPSPDPDAAAPPPLLAQVREVIRSARPVADRRPELPAGFRPDPEPITDPVVRRLLLAGVPGVRSARPGPADLLVGEVARVHATLGAAAMVDAVERRLVPGGGDPAQRTRVTADLETDLMTALVDVRPGQVLCDPATGVANLIITAVRRSAAGDGRQTIGVVGRELDPRTWLVAKIRLGLHGIAHDLGAPGADALRDATLVGPFDRVVVDPGGGARVLGAWCDRAVALLAADGVAIARFPPTDVLPPGREAPRRGWWDRAASSVAAIVVTARYPHSPGGTGLLVLRHDAGAPVLLAQVYSPPPDQPLPDGPTRTDWVDAAAVLVRDWLDRPGSLLPGWIGTTFVRLLDDLSTEALGGIDRDDLEVVLRFKEDFLGIVRAAPAPPRGRGGPGRVGSRSPSVVVDAPAPAPAPRRSARRDVGTDDPLLAEALRAVAFLRALTDPAAPLDDDLLLGLGPKDRLRYSTGVTEEMRRALKRLEQRLRGEETRGRKPGTG